MSLLRRIQQGGLPRPGEVVEVYQHDTLLAAGTVVAVDEQTVSVADKRGLVDLDTTELRRGLSDGSIRIYRPPR
jgi:hypothetical protein